MQVQAIPVPVVARRSRFGTVPALFVSVSEDLAAYTLPTDDRGTTFAVDGAASVWVALPIGREVLLAAWMLSGAAGVDRPMVESMTDDEIRCWALEQVAYYGCGKAKDEMGSVAFRSGYRRGCEDSAELVAYFAVVCARVDAAFGFADAAPVPARRRGPVTPDTTVTAVSQGPVPVCSAGGAW